MHLSAFSPATRSLGHSCVTCSRSAARLLDAKEGAYVTSVAMLLTHDMRLATIAQPREEP